MAFFIQPVSNNFQLRFYGFALSLLFSLCSLSVTTTPAHAHSRLLFISYSHLHLCYYYYYYCVSSQFTRSVLFDPNFSVPTLLSFPTPLLLPFSSLPASHIFSFSFMASCSGLGNEGSVIKYGRCLGAGSQPVYQQTKKLKLDEDGDRGGKTS